MAHETTFQVSSMTKLDGEGAKALANVVLNGEFALSGIKVRTGADGELKVSPPSQQKFDGNYEDIYFPITTEAQAALKKAVLDVYNDMTAKGEDKYKADIPLNEKPVSSISARMSDVNKGNVKASGQVVIDDCFVITGVKMMNGTNQDGVNKNFVSMPSRQTATGTYFDYAKPITTAAHDKLNKAVTGSYNLIGKVEYAGCKFGELGDKANVKQSGRLNNTFAQKVMEKLDAAGIQYHAKISETTTLSVKSEDMPKLNEVKKALVNELNPQKQDAPKQEQKQTHGKAK